MGITKECKSSVRQLQRFQVPVTEKKDGENATSTWGLSTAENTVLDIDIKVAAVDGVEDAIQVSLGDGAQAYWAFKGELTLFKGPNLLPYYDNEIEFKVG